MKGREKNNVGSHGNVTMVTPPPGGVSGNQGSSGAREEEMDGILAGDTPETQRYCFGEEERSTDGDDCSTIPERYIYIYIYIMCVVSEIFHIESILCH